MQITCALCPPRACARAIGGVTRYLAQEGGGGHTQGPIFSDPWHRDNRRKMEDTYDGDIYSMYAGETEVGRKGHNP